MTLTAKAKGLLKKIASGRDSAPKNAPVANNAMSPDAPTHTYKHGEMVTVTRGEAHQDTQGLDGSPGGGTTRLGGKRLRVDGQPYVAVDGPNKGKVITTLKDPETGRLYGATTDRLQRVQGGHASARVGWTPGYDEAYRRAFGHD